MPNQTREDESNVATCQQLASFLVFILYILSQISNFYLSLSQPVQLSMEFFLFMRTLLSLDLLCQITHPCHSMYIRA